MIVKPDSEKIRYTGYWNISDALAEATTNGSYFEFCFKGITAVMAFDVACCKHPFPHIFVCVDDGALISMPVDSYVRINCDFGKHVVKVIMKSSSEDQERWHHPIEARCAFLGVDADEIIPLCEDSRKKIEFIGDSITEGISIDVLKESYFGNESSMVDWDDSTAGYAYLTAKALNLRPYINGYGCRGVTKGGAGCVPEGIISYAYYSDGCPMESVNADYIVINYGTNDTMTSEDEFVNKYYAFLKEVRNRNKNSKIISLTPFSGRRACEIKKCVDRFNIENEDDVFFVDSTGWIPAEPIHPDRKNHKIVSEKLAEIFKKEIL